MDSFDSVEDESFSDEEESAVPYFVQGLPFPREMASNPQARSQDWRFSFERVRENADGTFQYRGRTWTSTQLDAERTRLEETYSVHVEFNLDRDWESTTRSKHIRRLLFEKCRPLEELCPSLPSSWKNRFRVNAYGNVLSLEAELYALTYADVDHNMPRVRGGSSDPANLELVYWHANRHVKRDALIPAAPPSFWERMNCGVRVEDVREIATVFAGEELILQRVLSMLEQGRRHHLEVARDKGSSLLRTLLDEAEEEVLRMKRIVRVNAQKL